ncbi:MAG: molybdenum cofactor biosynthesis protein MoeB [Thermoflexus sp.]|mgnify:CR=1 FL=1|uniref:molybdopterin-synthase adenylyltransferase MoeB n=1 Tax=Thermoflexus sp. TaxID=1969742 RepID=UPI003317638B
MLNVNEVVLTHEEIRRYSRHLLMPEVGLAGQKKLKAASVLIIGAGGLGSPAALYLAAAGVGRIGLVDFDVVDESNLQRQILHGTSWVGKPKLASAKARLLDLNPDITVETHEVLLNSQNARDILRDYDIIIDGTDNFPTRYLVNDACVFLGKPLIYGSIFRFEGQATVFDARVGPCYRCLYPEPPPPGLVPSCAEGGVFGVLPGVIGAIQATEAIKLIIGQGEPLIGRLLLYDALSMRFRELRLRKNPACPVCGENPTIRELIDYEAFCGVRVIEEHVTEFDITPRELKAMLERDGQQIVLLDVRELHEWEICHLEGAVLIPLRELPEQLHRLDPTREYVVYCKSGARSAQAARILQSAGLRVKHLRGGINAWAREVDPSIPVY